VNILKQTLWIVLLFFFQQLPGVAAWGVDLPLLFVILKGVRTDVPRAAGWGFLLGLLQDFLSSGWIGPNTTAKTLTGVFASLSKRHVYRERVITQSLLVLLATLFHQIFIWIILKWDDSAPDFANAIGIVLKTVGMTTLVGVGACFLLARFRKRRFDPATA
jgi:rod shape-determining protein MreD